MSIYISVSIKVLSPFPSIREGDNFFYKYTTGLEQVSTEKYPEGRRQSLLAIPKAIFQYLPVDGRLGILCVNKVIRCREENFIQRSNQTYQLHV